MSKDDHIDKFKVDYEEWYVYKDSDTSYTYMHFPHSFVGEDERYKIIVSFMKNEMGEEAYLFDAQEYCELHGSGDWTRWTHWEDELKDKILEDIKSRIKID